jgi:ATP-dependent RNA helicase DDX23/PRP28
VGRADGAIGRTGRAGKLGTAITFLTNDDDEVMWVFLKFIFADYLC